MRNIVAAALLLAAATATAGPFRGHQARVSRADNGLTLPSSAAAADVVRGYLGHADRSLTTARENRGTNGATHVQLAQTIGGRDVYGAYVKATVDAQGRLTSVIDASVDTRGGVARTTLTNADALSAALAHRYGSAARPAFYRDPIV